MARQVESGSQELFFGSEHQPASLGAECENEAAGNPSLRLMRTLSLLWLKCNQTGGKYSPPNMHTIRVQLKLTWVCAIVIKLDTNQS